MRSPLLLLPHALSALCFLAAHAWMTHAGSNRTAPDLYFGLAGYALAVVALVASAVALARHPWGSGWRRGAAWLAAHVAAVAGLLFLGLAWLALHIA
jgi:hypothetical protein